MSKPKIIAMIPARIGSTRLKMKNLALINGKPLIYYVIEAAKQSGVFDQIVLNADHELFAEIAKHYGVDFYLRPEQLGGSSVKSDDVVYDFMRKHLAEITAWVNPTSPLQAGEEVKKAIKYFLTQKLDSLFTVREEQVHCLYGGRPLNFNTTEQFAQTQDIIPISRFVYSIMIWRNTAFNKAYKAKGYAFFCGKVGYFPISKESSLIVKTKEDLRLIDFIVTGREQKQGKKLEYDLIAQRGKQ
ncbi:MAG: hypothetical protein HZA94_02345 [Candidatus Vogelbacteria bacterium]|nr:hypothetical protein [Candidatus Vogelbacteria bacterium]